ncbi:AraC family transcriptional regulator [Silvibacterium dinghuense]|uniref:AraC family transcriptional regulator n=1 Tax=Silvibacterium dinghuense TaxID=1560006 RepID=A0A4Q1S8M6_9BACT|nr:AraC family transcriptional regulator [Silvibacterium dinghuense]RXS93347.1 AraC family transcriptional regulator [Silvibacterium dinghuense]
MKRQFRIARGLRGRLEELGVAMPAVLQRAGLPQDFFEQPSLMVSTDALFALWRAIGEVSSPPLIGLSIAEARPERFSPNSLAALSAENFGAAVSQLGRYKQLTCPEELVQETTATEWRVVFRWLLAVDAEPQALVDSCFAWLLTLGRYGSGTPVTPLRVEYVQQRSHQRLIEKHFGCPVICGAARNRIVFRAADARLPFITRNAELLDMLAPQLEQQLRNVHGEDSFVMLVRRAIQERMSGRRPAIDDIARTLHLSPRTLQRRLQEAGVTFQSVLDEARHQMARYYLGNSVLELTEAAYLLGYEDANSFVRAFRGWEGVPPGQWRDAHRTAS